MKSILRSRFILWVLVLSSILFSACTSPDAGQAQEDSLHGAPPEFVLLGEEKPGKENIYLIIKVLDSSYWKVIVNAAQDAAEEFDCNVWCSGSNSETEWYFQETLLKTALERGADAVVLAPDDSVKLSAAVGSCYQSGTPIVLIDTVVNTEQYDLCYMTDNLMAGQIAAEEMICELKGMGISENEDARVAIQVGSSYSQTISERLAGFCQYWSKNAPEKWVIIDEIKINEGSVDNAVVCAEEFFDTYEGIKGVFGSNNGSTVGFARYLLEQDRTDVAIVGFDYSEEMAALIADDRFYSATLLQRQYDMGHMGIESALAMIHGEYTGDKKFVDTGVLAVNKSNLSEPQVQQVIECN